MDASRRRHLLIGAALLLAAGAAALALRDLRDRGPVVWRPTPGGAASGVPLDPASPWPKFRANALQTGRSPVRPVPSTRKPWIFETGGGVFSSPVVDADGTTYVGSADHSFYAIRADGSLAWSVRTGEVIDSAALLDDRGRVYVPSGDGFLYALERATGRTLWRFRALTPAEVEARHGIAVHNLDWWEGSVAILPDGTLLAGNDASLYYRIDRDTGEDRGQWVVNELGWSLPAVDARTGRVFLGTMFVALRNLFAFDARSGARLWTTGALGPIVTAPLLTAPGPDGAVVVGGFDGSARAFRQSNGRQLWAFATRDHVYASPAQLSDGRLVLASTDGTVYALDPARGTRVWSFDTLEPIRSSPAVDGEDHVYVGSGAGELLALDPDGRLRWAYRCAEGPRNDLNGSPALGPDGIYVGGEDGSICFVPWDWCRSEAGRADPRCRAGGGQEVAGLPPDGARLYFTGRFGGLERVPPRCVDGNEALAFTLVVRRAGATIQARIEPDSLAAELSTGAAAVDLSADRRFVTLVPATAWIGRAGGTLRVRLRGRYRTDPWRIGLLAFGGAEGGRFDETFAFAVRARAPAPMPYAVPHAPGDAGTAFELGRLAAPLPTMLPSWNQIGFDSLRYLGGLVEGNGSHAIVWMVGGRRDASGAAVIDPASHTRFPLVLDWDDGLVTLREAGPFALDFNGSWAMPYRRYRIATRAAADGAIERAAGIDAVVDADAIGHYGWFLKLLGLSDLRTGLLYIHGAGDLSVWGDAPRVPPDGVGRVAFEVGPRAAVAHLTGGRIRAREHALGLLLVDAASGRPLPLDYALATEVESDASGAPTAVRVRYAPGAVHGPVRAYYLVDTTPVARAAIGYTPGISSGQFEATVPPSISNTLPVTQEPAGEQR